MPPEDELAEPIPDVRGSAARGRVLHKLMEEILLGETPDDEASLRTRAAELLRQLGENDHPDPSEGPSSLEIASTIRRTLQLPVVAQYRPGAATGTWSVPAEACWERRNGRHSWHRRCHCLRA